MLGLVVLLGIGLVSLWLAGVAATLWMLTHPPRRTYAWAVAKGRPGDPSELPEAPAFEEWFLDWRGLRLPVWDIVSPEITRSDGEARRGASVHPKPAVIVTHGWGDSRVSSLLRVPTLLEHAGRIVLWDLPGHGDAGGVCTLGAREVGALRALIDRVAGPGGSVALCGSSLGAGLSIAAALGEARVRGVIAESPYRLPGTPARHVLRARRMPWRTNLAPALWLLGAATGVGPRWRAFDRAELAAGMRCPVLVIHGDADRVCPLQDGETIAHAAGTAAGPAAVSGPRLGEIAVIPGGGHNDLWTDARHAAACRVAIARFFERLGSLSAPRPTSLQS